MKLSEILKDRAEELSQRIGITEQIDIDLVYMYLLETYVDGQTGAIYRR